MVENQQDKQPTQLEEKLAVIEQRLNDIAANLNVKADEQADALVAKWAKKLIDSRFTWAFIVGAVVYAVMSFYICV